PPDLAVAASPEEGYRMRARLHVRGRRVGFFREATHDLCDVRAAEQLPPETCDAVDRLTATMKSLGIDAVREIELTENVDASHRVVAVDTEGPIDSRAVGRLASTEGLTGLVSATGVHGDPHVVDRVDVGGRAVVLRRHVLAFFQGNRYLMNDL